MALMVFSDSFILFGQFTLPMAFITFIWGILGGVGGNINQYWLAYVKQVALVC